MLWTLWYGFVAMATAFQLAQCFEFFGQWKYYGKSFADVKMHTIWQFLWSTIFYFIVIIICLGMYIYDDCGCTLCLE